MQFGEVQSVRIIKDIETGNSRGFAFVQFDSERSARKAESVGDGEEFEGRTLRVKVSERKDRRPPRGDRYE